MPYNIIPNILPTPKCCHAILPCLSSGWGKLAVLELEEEGLEGDPGGRQIHPLIFASLAGLRVVRIMLSIGHARQILSRATQQSAIGPPPWDRR